MTELQKSYGTLSDAQLANFVSLGDDRAFDELVVRYLDTISIIARKFSAEGYEHNDFVQEGLVGLLCSCKTFDQNGGKDADKRKKWLEQNVDFNEEDAFIKEVKH